MNAAPGGGLRAAGGLWGPPARALCETLGRRFPQRHRPTWLSPGADQPTPVLIRLLVAGWLTFRVAAPRLSPATTWGPSPANLVVANRPRGLTRDSNPGHVPRLLGQLSQYTLVCNSNDPQLGGERAEIFSHPLQVTTSIQVGYGKGCPPCQLQP